MLFLLNLVQSLLTCLLFLTYLNLFSRLLLFSPSSNRSSFLHLSHSFSVPSYVFLASSSNRCGSLSVTNRPEVEGCLCPFSLITSHLCVHKHTNNHHQFDSAIETERVRRREREEKIKGMGTDEGRV